LAKVTSQKRKRSIRATAEQVTFVIQAENRADVLPRVVMLFHRLNVEVAALYFVQRQGSETMRLSVTVEADRERAMRMEAHLYKIAYVVSVKAEHGTKDRLNLLDPNEQRVRSCR
jgi:acetolactate synthase small subunit